MPYNSTAFEKQLAKYKAAKDNTRPKDAIDHHVARSKVASFGGEIRPTYVSNNEDKQGKPAVHHERAATQAPDVLAKKPRKRPIYLRGWFLFWMFNLASLIAMPVFYKEETAMVVGIIEQIKASGNGGKAFSLTALKQAFRPPPNNNLSATAPVTTPAVVTIDPTNLGAAIDAASANAHAIAGQGSAASMKYIENETKRLKEMAEQIQKQSGE